MIRINLLPYHEAKKKAGKAKEVIIFLAITIIFSGVILLYHSYMFASIKDLEQKVLVDKNRVAELDKVVGTIKEFQESKAILENKIGVIEKLEAGREFPVFMFQQLTSIIPGSDLSLNTVSQSGSSLSLDGIARNPTTVAQFMKSLELLPFVVSVDLDSSRQEEVSGGTKIQVFKIRCAIKKG